MKFLPYLLKHLRRNWFRTGLHRRSPWRCASSSSAPLQSVLAAINSLLESTSANRLVTRHAVSLVFNLPLAYKARIEGLDGVKRASVAAWFGGLASRREGGAGLRELLLDHRLQQLLPEHGGRARALPRHVPRVRAAPRAVPGVPPGPAEGAVIGRKLADRFGWKVGDTFFLESFIPPYRKPDGPFEFVVNGIFDTDEARYPGTDTNMMLFNYKYLYEATGRNVGAGTYYVEIDDPDRAGEISQAIDDLFANSDAATRTETEKAFAAGFISMAGNLALLLNGIGLAVTFTILLVTANTMSMAVRERRTEIAVLKTLGFKSGQVMGLVVAEALLLGVLGGALGIGGSHAIMWTADPRPGDQRRPGRDRALASSTSSPWWPPLGLRGGGLPRVRGRVRPRARGLPGADHRHAEDGLMALPLSYNIRNVRVRWQVTLLAVVGIALVVAVFAVLMSMSEGFKAALRSTGRTDNAIIVQRGSASELTSGVPLDDRNKIVVDERIARDAEGTAPGVVGVGGGHRPAPPERRHAGQHHPSAPSPPGAFEVRGGIDVVEGRSFTPGLDEVIVGRKLLDRIEGMEVGGTVKYQQKSFDIVGDLRVPGRRLRERDLGRLRHLRGDLPAGRRAATRSWSG